MNPTLTPDAIDAIARRPAVRRTEDHRPSRRIRPLRRRARRGGILVVRPA